VHEGSPSLEPLTGLLRQARRRLRMGCALAVALRGATPALLTAAACIAGARLCPGHERALALGLALLGAALAGATLCALAYPLPFERVATMLDQRNGLDSRLGSALSFAALSARDPFMRAHIGDALRAAARVDARASVPVAAPARLYARVGAAALVALAALAVHRAPARLRPALAAHVAAPERMVAAEGRAALAATVRDATDPEVRAVVDRVTALLEAFERGAIDRKQLLAELSEIERALAATEPGDPTPLARALAEMGDALARTRPTAALGQAVQGSDPAGAERELAQLAERAQGAPGLDASARAQTARALADTAQAMRRLLDPTHPGEAQKQRALLEQQQRQLEQLRRAPQDAKTAEQRRQLERLTRNRARDAATQAQLEQLARDLQESAEQMGSGAGPGRGDAAQRQSALTRAAPRLGQLVREARGQAAGARIRAQLGDLKEAMRRAGEAGKSGDGKGAMSGFLARAGQRATGGVLVERGDTAQGDVELMSGGAPSAAAAAGQAPGQPGAASGSARAAVGGGIGRDPGGAPFGAATRPAGKPRDVAVAGNEGEGARRSEVIYTAAERGFATRSYRRVYADYTRVLENVMRDEQIPPGMRYYVKRYFDLIRPRE
jgi:hypothetical protein